MEGRDHGLRPPRTASTAVAPGGKREREARLGGYALEERKRGDYVPVGRARHADPNPRRDREGSVEGKGLRPRRLGGYARGRQGPPRPAKPPEG